MEPNDHYASPLYRMPMLGRHPVERLFRDAQVVRQHGFVAASRYESAAQVLLGLESDLPLIHL
jgi:hypothetical protein